MIFEYELAKIAVEKNNKCGYFLIISSKKMPNYTITKTYREIYNFFKSTKNIYSRHNIGLSVSLKRFGTSRNEEIVQFFEDVIMHQHLLWETELFKLFFSFNSHTKSKYSSESSSEVFVGDYNSQRTTEYSFASFGRNNENPNYSNPSAASSNEKIIENQQCRRSLQYEVLPPKRTEEMNVIDNLHMLHQQLSLRPLDVTSSLFVEVKLRYEGKNFKFKLSKMATFADLAKKCKLKTKHDALFEKNKLFYDDGSQNEGRFIAIEDDEDVEIAIERNQKLLIHV